MMGNADSRGDGQTAHVGSRLLFCLIIGFFCIFSHAGLVDAAPDSFKPQYSEAFIESGKAIIRPVGVAENWQSVHVAGNTRFVLNGASLTIVPQMGDESKTSAPEGACWRWLTCDDRFAYLTTFKRTRSGIPEASGKPIQISRFDCKSGRPAGEIAVNPGDGGVLPWRPVVLQAMAKGDQFVVLTANVGDTLMSRGFELDAYQVSCYSDDGKSLRWTRRFQSAGHRQEPSAFVISASPPAYADSSVQHLSWIGDNKLIVCAGGVQPILCLYSRSGKTCWKCERIWEYDRDFIGPSIWQHLMTRIRKDQTHGASDSGHKPNPVCAIVGGPVVVAGAQDDKQRIFVAVAKGPEHEFSGYLADCVVYELGFDGKPIAVVSVPRMIHGNVYAIHQSAVVWACDESALLRIEPSKQAERIGTGGMGEPDCIGLITWYRQLVIADRDAWLDSKLSTGPIAFTMDHAILFQAGGYILLEDDSRFRFAIQVVNLKDGSSRSMTLVVPFKGKALPPTMNYECHQLPDGSMHYRAHGVYLLGVRHVDVVADEVRVGIASEKSTATCRFRVQDLVGGSHEH